jgi:hypothetical protein
MQYVIEVRTPGDAKATRYVCDKRGRAPSYATFDLVSSDVCTVAPDMAFAKEVRNAFVAFCKAHPETGYSLDGKKIVLVPWARVRP